MTDSHPPTDTTPTPDVAPPTPEVVLPPPEVIATPEVAATPEVTPTTPPATPRLETATEVAATATVAAAEPVDMERRSASEAYVFAAVLCAVVGIVIPVLPAAAALMLTRATDDDMTAEPLRPQLVGMKSFARGLAWFDLAWMTLLTLAFLLSTLGRVIG